MQRFEGHAHPAHIGRHLRADGGQGKHLSCSHIADQTAGWEVTGADVGVHERGIDADGDEILRCQRRTRGEVALDLPDIGRVGTHGHQPSPYDHADDDEE